MALPTLHLVDASMYVFRAYYSVAPEFSDHEGQPVHAVQGFLSFLLTLVEQSKPTHLMVAFDESLTTSFRNRLYPAYKANRELPPPDLDRQFAYCREVATALGACVLSDAEYEADDLIGSALARVRAHGYRGVIVTGDKDLTQLLGEHDQVWDFAKRERFGRDDVPARMGVRADQVADFLALTGDAVDNIPGVPGVGPKTASALLAHFGSLDALLARLDEVAFLRGIRGAASAAARIREHREQALLSRALSVIALDAPAPQQPEDYARRAPDLARADELLDRLRFGPLTRRRVREMPSPG
ncbi:MAG: exodeoxyribonuclease IX [Xanthomonadaceae bacterium]|jgi:5'-3' exonuclease|nr:exodeoxyribonuclease IX [Xanthomonadaceae bacterium]